MADTTSAVEITLVYDPSRLWAFREKPKRVKVVGGHWHYEYGENGTIETYHDASVYPDC